MGLAESRQEAFWDACGFGHVEAVKFFLRDSSIQVDWISRTHNCSPIHVASQGKPEIVKMLINAHCNLESLDDRGNTAMHHAAMKGETEIIKILADAGAQVDVRDKSGWTPLFCSSYYCFPDSVRELLRIGANVHLKNIHGRNPLHESCRSRSTDSLSIANIVTQLLKSAASDRQKFIDCASTSPDGLIGVSGFTPLMFAAYHGHFHAAKVLISHNCNLNIQDERGWTALHWASERGHAEIVKLLICAEAEQSIENNCEETALDRAASSSIRNIFFEDFDSFDFITDVPSIVLSTPSETNVCMTSLNGDINDNASTDNLSQSITTSMKMMIKSSNNISSSSKCKIINNHHTDDEQNIHINGTLPNGFTLPNGSLHFDDNTTNGSMILSRGISENDQEFTSFSNDLDTPDFSNDNICNDGENSSSSGEISKYDNVPNGFDTCPGDGTRDDDTISNSSSIPEDTDNAPLCLPDEMA